MSWAVATIVALTGAVGLSCGASSAPGALHAPCEHPGDCASGLACVAGVCMAASSFEDDASSPNGTADADTLDAHGAD